MSGETYEYLVILIQVSVCDWHQILNVHCFHHFRSLYFDFMHHFGTMWYCRGRVHISHLQHCKVWESYSVVSVSVTYLLTSVCSEANAQFKDWFGISKSVKLLGNGTWFAGLDMCNTMLLGIVCAAMRNKWKVCDAHLKTVQKRSITNRNFPNLTH